MIEKLARVVVAVDDLEAAVRDYRLLLGREVSSASGEAWVASAGEGASFALRNTTLQLVDRRETEIAGRAPPEPGVAALVFEESGRDAGDWLGLGETRGIPIALDRDDRESAGPAAEIAPAAETVAALDHVVISTADLEAARALYGTRLGLRLALDRAFPKRGIQILFFRTGGTTVEVVGALRDAPRAESISGEADAPDDRFGGLAWEVEDVDAVHGRLAREGFDVSEIRVGHKPGTRVCTVRGPTHGVPTLLKGPD
jgi:catechol 2,3-dioxygenase-like lactoylglutathione lyase family enzyme